MSATAFQIANKIRQQPLGGASIQDFQLSEPKQVSSGILLNSPYISLYSLDFEMQRAVFVETPEAVKLSEASFYWMAQYEQAIRVMTLSFADFIVLANQISIEPCNLNFIYSTGRAGSTLASQIFSCVDSLDAISEPDALTLMVAARHAARAKNQDSEHILKPLLAASVRFLCKSRTATHFVIKGRSQTAEIGDWLHELFPQAKTFFLYRNAESWLVSAKRAFTDDQIREPAAQIALEKATRAYLAPVTELVATYPENQHLSFVELLVLTWLSAMNACLRMQHMGVEMLPISFLSWRSQPEETARKMLAYCDCEPSSSDRLLDVLSCDSQADTVLGRKRIQQSEQRRSQSLLPDDVEKLNYHLHRHDTIRSADFIIPGTL
ncbi:MAG: hypothetical protein AB8B99_15945 [Phormidesmis sp.]